MLRRLVKLILAHKRNHGDAFQWRRLYEREKREWAKERQHLLNQVLIKNQAAPMATEPEQPYEREVIYSDEELDEIAIAEHNKVLAQSAAFDDFDYAVAQLNAQRDPQVWKPILEEATALRRNGQLN